MRLKNRKLERLMSKLKFERTISYVILITIVGLGIAYSAFSSTMNISGIVAEVRVKKDVRITGVRKGNDIGNQLDSEITEFKIYGNSTQETIPLPSDYQQVEYIESTGTQYIDTGVKPNATQFGIDTKMSIDISAIDQQQYALGSSNVDAPRRPITIEYSYAGKGVIIAYSKSSSNKYFIIPYTNGILNIYYNVSGTSITAKINSNEFSDSCDSYSDNNNNIYLFSHNRGGSPKFDNFVKIYSFKMTSNDSIVRNFIPCYRRSDGVIGLYDTINNAFYTNQGTGTFNKGNNVTYSIQNVGDYDSTTGKYKIPITINQTTYDIYLDEPLRKVGNYIDYIDIINKKVVRNVEVIDSTGELRIEDSYRGLSTPQEQSISMESVDLDKKTITISLDTKLKPSKIRINEHDYTDLPNSLSINTTGNSNYLDYNKDNINGTVNLPDEDSFVVLEVDITNFGNVETGIYSITGLPDNLEYELINYKLKDKICNNTGSCSLGINKKLYISIGYKNGEYDENNTTFNIQLNFNFQQFYNVTYTNITGNYPNEVICGDTLVLDFSNDPPLYINVKRGNDTTQDYTYNNNILTIGNIYSDIEVLAPLVENLSSTNGVLIVRDSKFASPIDFKLYGNSVQNGTPTPTNPVEIENVGDLVTDTSDENYGKYKIPISIQGKNLFNLNNINTTYAATDYKGGDSYLRGYAKVVDNVVEVYYGATGNTIYLKGSELTLRGGQTITISADAAIFEQNQTTYNKIVFGIVKKGDSTTLQKEIVTLPSRGEYYRVSATVTVPEDGKYLLRLQPNEGQSGKANTDVRFKNIQIEDGANMTEYEDYNEISYNVIYLDEPLMRVGEHADYIDFQSNKLVRIIDKKLLRVKDVPGSVLSGYSIGRDTTYFNSSGSLAFEPLCKYLIGTNEQYYNVANTIDHYRIGTVQRQQMMVTLPESVLGTNSASTSSEIVNAINNWATTNNVMVYYPLATPREQSISLPEITLNSDTTRITIGTSVAPSNLTLDYYK